MVVGDKGCYEAMLILEVHHSFAVLLIVSNGEVEKSHTRTNLAECTNCLKWASRDKTRMGFLLE